MTLILAFIGALILGSAALAMSLRNLIYSALLLILTWAGVASFYLWAGAEFVAFGQLLIYVGAVSMVVLFAVLLTRRSLADPLATPLRPGRAIAALLAGGAVAAVLCAAALGTSFDTSHARPPSVSVRQLGFQLMNQHAASLLVVGVILTVALIGATVLASSDRENPAAPLRRSPSDVVPVDSPSTRQAAAPEETTP